MPVSSQEFVPVTADTLICLFHGDFDLWEQTMEANGFRPPNSSGSVARELGPLFILGNPPDNYMSMSKDTGQVTIQLIRPGGAEPGLTGLFGEVASGGMHVGSQETYVFDNLVKIDYYLYKGYWFGLHCSQSPSRTEETVYVIEPFQ